MAALWPLSRTKEYDINGDPIVGAKANFYNVGTSTPQTVYADASLSDAYSTDNPVVTDGYGRWPAVYHAADPGAYRQRVVDADDVLLFDDDDIDVPLAAAYSPPDAGDTSTELLFQTGDLKPRYGTGALAGYVRCGGRTIGSATSGATERANADCEDLFLFLWSADANLSVSGGRGANAASDWAANKTIALPDLRDRAMIGLGDMGNSDANRIDDATVDNSKTNTTLGATVGSATHTLTTSQMPTHSHTATSGNAGSHDHDFELPRGDAIFTQGTNTSNNTIWGNFNGAGQQRTISTDTAPNHSHTVTVQNAGSGQSHPNVQPSMFVTIYIKL